MKKKRLIIPMLFTVCIAVAANDDISFEKAKKAQTQEKRREAFREQYNKLKPVTVYGKIVDQNGDPVPGADVKVSWEKATFLIGQADHGRDDWVKSGIDGCFMFTCDRPFAAFAYAYKGGYESPLSSSGEWQEQQRKLREAKAK